MSQHNIWEIRSGFRAPRSTEAALLRETYDLLFSCWCSRKFHLKSHCSFEYCTPNSFIAVLIGPCWEDFKFSLYSWEVTLKVHTVQCKHFGPHFHVFIWIWSCGCVLSVNQTMNDYVSGHFQREVLMYEQFWTVYRYYSNNTNMGIWVWTHKK